MKIKYKLVEKLKNLTQSEYRLLIYIAQICNEENSFAEGLYYRDAMDACGFCKQSFYNALRGLEDKEIITVEKNSDVDFDVTIIGNGFPWQGTAKRTYSEGYVSLARPAFATSEFKALKSKEKYLVFEFLKHTHASGHSYCMGVANFYKEWTSRLNVSKRVLCGYLHNLKALFSIGIKNGKYYITYLHSKFEKKNNTKTEESYSWEQLIKKECHRRHIDYTDQAAADTAGLVGQYRKLAGSTERAITQVIRGIARSVDGIKNKERQLNAKYVHHIIKEFLSVPDSGTKETGSNHSKNRFNNFHQRDYDYSELEKVLLTTEI